MDKWEKFVGGCFAIAAVGIACWMIGEHFSLNKGEWAAWVQAVGSIAAILGAIWIANQQHVQALAREHQQAIRQRQDMRKAIFVVANQSYELITGIPATTNNEEWIRYLQFAPQVHFQNLEGLLRGAPLYEVGGLAFTAAIQMMEALERASRLLAYSAAMDPIQRAAVGIKLVSDVHSVHRAAYVAMEVFRLEMGKTDRGE